MEHTLNEKLERYVLMAVRVWNVDPEGKPDLEIAKEGISRLRQFWESIGAPSRLSYYGIDGSTLDLIADKAMANGEFGQFKKLNKEDVLTILHASL